MTNDELDRKEGESENDYVDRLRQNVEERLWADLAVEICIPKLREIIEHGEQESAVVKAVSIVFDRAYGKPLEKVEHSGEVTIHKEVEEDQLKRFAKRHVKGKTVS